MNRVPVRMRIRIDQDGVKKPLSFVWSDGCRYAVEGVTGSLRLSQTKAAQGEERDAGGTRYTVILRGLPAHIYEEDGIWSVEAQRP